MKKLITALLLFAALATTLSANKEAQIERMLKLANVSNMMDSVLQQMQAQLDRQFQPQATTDAKKAIVEKYTQEIVSTTKAALEWNKIKKPFIELYMKVYTEKELKELIKFYESPVGKKMIAKMPELMQKTMILSQQLMRPMIPKIQAIAKKMSEELQAAK
jgi:hypothetical protein